MCGIFGVISKSSETKKDLVKELHFLGKLSESRGKEASGIIYAQEKKRYFSKLPEPMHSLIHKSQYKQFLKETITEDASLPLAAVGHARLVTNGSKTNPLNNQPVVVESALGVHNGIVCNVDFLKGKYSDWSFKSDLDSEVLFRLIQDKIDKEKSPGKALKKAFEEIKGTINIAYFCDKSQTLLIATNNGSVYYLGSEDKLVFASEAAILEDWQKEFCFSGVVTHLRPNKYIQVNLEKFSFEEFSLEDASFEAIEKTAITTKEFHLANKSFVETAPLVKTPGYLTSKEHSQKLQIFMDAINGLKRCTKCILPETHPYIDFDKNGVCSFCRAYEPIEMLPEEDFYKTAEKHKRTDGKPDCIVPLSGGRDSSYLLHIVKDMGLNPVAYSYDWGLVTDLARRNQALMCGELGVEHIIISANIEAKRKYVRQNVSAWLKKPHLGIIPLFMAGDKMFFTYANELRDKMGIDFLIFGMNEFENNDFKEGFCNIRRERGADGKFYDLNAMDKLRMLGFYGKEYLFNPAYLNSSMWDTAKAFSAYYLAEHKYTLFYKYFQWNEKEINRVLINKYNWETSPDTPSTWRIGDGTASFYNYIYYTIAGFSESEPMRSNQIREGQITREEALEISLSENQPRYESLKWYCDTIGLAVDDVIKRIDEQPRRYRIK